MSNLIRCPECGSDDAECIRKPHHEHRCHTCGHSLNDPLRSIARWVVETFDFPGGSAFPPPPRRLRDSIYRYLHDQCSDGLSHDEVVAWVHEEAGWPVPAAGEAS